MLLVRPSTYVHLIKSIYMHLVLEDADSNDQQVECRHCHWQGAINELKGRFFFIKQYYRGILSGL